MALDKSSLKVRIIAEMDAQGFITSEPLCEASKMAEALANAIIDEITINAQCNGKDTNGDDHATVSII